MTDELKQWEYDKGYENGKADMLKVIEDIKAELADYEKTCKVWSANQLKDDVKRCTSCINGTFGRINEIFDRHLGTPTCSDCILDLTDACSRGAGRAVDDEICEDFLTDKAVMNGTPLNDLLQRLRKRISDLYNTDVTYDNGDYNTMDTPTLDKVLEYFDSEVQQ